MMGIQVSCCRLLVYPLYLSIAGGCIFSSLSFVRQTLASMARVKEWLQRGGRQTKLFVGGTYAGVFYFGELMCNFCDLFRPCNAGSKAAKRVVSTTDTTSRMRGTAMLLQLYAERMMRQQREKADLAAAELSVGMQPGASAPAVRRRSIVAHQGGAGGGHTLGSDTARDQTHTVDDFMRAAAMLGIADAVITPAVRHQAAARQRRQIAGSPRKGPPASALLSAAVPGSGGTSPRPVERHDAAWRSEFRRLARVVNHEDGTGTGTGASGGDPVEVSQGRASAQKGPAVPSLPLGPRTAASGPHRYVLIPSALLRPFMGTRHNPCQFH